MTVPLDSSTTPLGEGFHPTQAPAPEAANGFWLRYIAAWLKRFQDGCLELRLPDGRSLHFGTPEAQRPPAVLRVRNPHFLRRLVLGGETALGDGYLAGDWDSPHLTRLLCCLARNLRTHPDAAQPFYRRWLNLGQRCWEHLQHVNRANTRTGSRRNITAHYDLGNTFYQLWLDASMTYSSAYFEAPGVSLHEAQLAKYRQLADKLCLKPGQRLLEIGCGWGSFALYAARHCGAQVDALTLSPAQKAFAEARIHAEGLQERIQIHLQDYRDWRGSYDRIVSIEMLEAVGHRFLPTFFRQCHRLLKADGVMGLQVILSPDARYAQGVRSADWIKKRIFPGGQLPSVSAILAALQRHGTLTLAHAETFGLHYAETLRQWRERFLDQRETVLAQGFDADFVRGWEFYLAYCEAAFATRNINVGQLVFTRPNNAAYTGPWEGALHG